jgi:hypothetical protein
VMRGCGSRVVCTLQNGDFSANMCLLTVTYRGFVYRTVFAKTAFLFATCWTGKLYYLESCIMCACVRNVAVIAW